VTRLTMITFKSLKLFLLVWFDERKRREKGREKGREKKREKEKI